MSDWAQLAARCGLLRDEPLARFTAARLGGAADWLYIAKGSTEELIAVVAAAWAAEIPVRILGGGANVLISDRGVRGLVIINDISTAAFEGETVTVSGGMALTVLARRCAARGLAGFEWAASVPGTVGGAVVNNAGAHGGDMSGSVREVTVVSPITLALSSESSLHPLPLSPQNSPHPPPLSQGERGEKHVSPSHISQEQHSVEQPAEDSDLSSPLSPWERGAGGVRASVLTPADLAYGYRTSSLKARADKRFLVTGAVLALRPDNPAAIQARMDAFIAHRKRTQPPGASLGSIFKNPAGDYAGRLIESCGLKGFQIGGAQVSPVHANFFINTGSATASDYSALIDHVQAVVYTKTGVHLEIEIERIGEW